MFYLCGQMTGKGNNIRILFASNDKIHAFLFRQFAKKSGLNIDTVFAESITGLLKLIYSENTPDYIFLDGFMLYENGSEPLPFIRIKPELNNVPIIVFSTWDKEVEYSYENGANLFIDTVVLFSNIVKVLKAVLAKPHSDYFPAPQKNNFIFQL